MEPRNPYAAPTALVSDPAQASEETRHFVVSPKKFTLMYLGTFSLYHYYWFYQHWAFLKRATRGSQWPVPRTMFGIFFYHSLFAEIDQTVRREGRRYDWSPGTQATLIVFGLLISYVIGRVSAYGSGSSKLDIVNIALLMALVIPKLSAQRAANIACDDPDGDANTRLTAANILWLLFGGLIWLMIGLGALVTFGVIPTD